MGLKMRRVIALALALVIGLALMGCAAAPTQTGSGTTPAKTATPGIAAGNGGTEILPAEGATDDSSAEKTSAQTVSDAALIDLRRERLGAKYGQTAETFATVNLMKLKGNYYITYSRTLVDGKPTSAYAATFVVDPKTKKIVSFNEKP